MYCRNYTGTVSGVLCRKVYYTVSLIIWESPLSEAPLYSMGAFVCAFKLVW